MMPDSDAVTKLAKSYMDEQMLKRDKDYMVGDIDHGLEEPRGGGFSIVKDLQDDLVKEQKQIHKGSSEVDGVVDRILSRTDLYQEMVEADGGLVVMEKNDITHDETMLLNTDQLRKIEIFYTAKVTYKIDVGGMCYEMGVSSDLYQPVADALAVAHGQINEYVERNGDLALFDPLLPCRPSDPEFELNWELVGAESKPEAYCYVTFQISERSVREEIVSA